MVIGRVILELFSLLSEILLRTPGRGWFIVKSCSFLVNIFQGGLLSALASLGMMIWLNLTPHSPQTEQKRLAILAGFAFLTGKPGIFSHLHFQDIQNGFS